MQLELSGACFYITRTRYPRNLSACRQRGRRTNSDIPVFHFSLVPFRVDVLDWVRASEEFRAIIRRDHASVVEGIPAATKS